MDVYVHTCVDKGPGLQYFVVSPSPVPCTSRSLSLSLCLSVSVQASKQALQGPAANAVSCFAHPELDWQDSILVELLWIASTFHCQQSKNKLKLGSHAACCWEYYFWHDQIAAAVVACKIQLGCCSIRLFWFHLPFGLVLFFFCFFFWGGLVHCFWTNIKSRSILVDGYYIHD